MVNSWQDLEVYKNVRKLQFAIFLASKNFPKEELYSLTDQVRRSSRSIGANIAEAWAKRRFPKHFQSKLSDSDAELQETIHWLSTALECQYINLENAEELKNQALVIGRQLGSMINQHEKFCY